MVHLKMSPFLYIFLTLSLTAVKCQNETFDDYDYLRIISGRPVRRIIPYQVSIQRKDASFQGQTVCSGIIISPDFFLTAAHCVDRRNETSFTIQAGVTDLASTLGSRHDVLAYKVHEDYLKGSVNNIAIAKVTPPFVLNGRTINAITYTSASFVGGGVSVLLSGWGAVDTIGAVYPRRLRLLRAETLTNFRCGYWYPNLTDSEICTRRTRFSGACNGDGGGPVTSLDGTILIGIISFGTPPCGRGRPDVHTRLSQFTDWIKEKAAGTWP